METNYNLNLDLSRIDYIFLNNDLQVNSEQDKQRDNILLDPFKLTYGEEQMLEKYLQIQLYKLPMERYDYLFSNLDDDVTYVLSIEPQN
jgi:hypothetical protein